MKMRRIDDDKWVNLSRVISIGPVTADNRVDTSAKTYVWVDDGANEVGIISSSWGPGKVFNSLVREDG